MNRRHFLAASSATAGGLFFAAPSYLGAEEISAFHVCPRSSAPARVIDAFRLEELTSYAWDIRLTLTTLQGLVNRKQPRLFLAQDRYDEMWLEWLKERGDIDEVRWREVGQIFEKYLLEASALFVIDPAIPASINVATMLAACRDGVACTPATARQYRLPMGAPPDSNKAGLDLRTFAWKKDVDAYRWAFQELDSSLSRKAIAYLDPYSVPLRDYLVSFRIPILWISAPEDSARNPQASPAEEFAFAREMLMKWPTNIPCFGWPGNSPNAEAGIGEWPGVRLASQCGKFEVCSGYDGYSPANSNLSVHSGTTADFRQPAVAPPKLQNNKTYLLFSRSDGDGLNFQRHYYRKLFDEAKRFQTPIAWQIGPCATDCQPGLLDYFYKHARPGDYFVNALSGVGYIWEDNFAENFPTPQREEIWREFLRLSTIYRARIDANYLSTFAEMSPSHLKDIASIEGIKGILANYGRSEVTTSENQNTKVGKVPVFRSVNHPPAELTFTPAGRRDAEAFLIQEVKRYTPEKKPAFLHVFLANWLTHIEMLENVATALGPSYVAVRPDQFVSLFEESRGA